MQWSNTLEHIVSLWQPLFCEFWTKRPPRQHKWETDEQHNKPLQVLDPPSIFPPCCFSVTTLLCSVALTFLPSGLPWPHSHIFTSRPLELWVNYLTTSGSRGALHQVVIPSPSASLWFHQVNDSQKWVHRTHLNNFHKFVCLFEGVFTRFFFKPYKYLWIHLYAKCFIETGHYSINRTFGQNWTSKILEVFLSIVSMLSWPDSFKALFISNKSFKTHSTHFFIYIFSFLKFS